ncbi:PepSY domain-containing protein [Paracoccus lutimaris]|uniref:Peptidase YpeB-like protein n=1 Tax=Paracoccus lutimaris TaxID=1490030 RepID=A0A368Z7D4_9RHOB|nr:PepSY domain-containing protein [Paracoccus lutimaris]RCW87067.1 peptidase YpeB-like protein [Paracoccus lutimaris]
MEKLTLLTLALLLAPLSAGGQAQIPHDFELARDAVERGEILPLAEVLSRLQESHPGRVIEVELEYSSDILVYEVELVTDDGRLIEVDMNAATGEIVKMDEED